MEKETLLAFIRRLAESGSQNKSCAMLCQLYEIMKTQGMDPELTELVKRSADSISEVKEAVKEDTFSEESLRVAIRRAEERRRREEEMRSYGRC